LAAAAARAMPNKRASTRSALPSIAAARRVERNRRDRPCRVGADARQARKLINSVGESGHHVHATIDVRSDGGSRARVIAETGPFGQHCSKGAQPGPGSSASAQ
jgi:hypothetical protein